jgi:hypothetical protein
MDQGWAMSIAKNKKPRKGQLVKESHEKMFTYFGHFAFCSELGGQWRGGAWRGWCHSCIINKRTYKKERKKPLKV